MTLRENTYELVNQSESIELSKVLQEIQTETVTQIDSVLSGDRLQFNESDSGALTAMDLLKAKANQTAILAMATLAANDGEQKMAA